jgi:hypothetical protein
MDAAISRRQHQRVRPPRNDGKSHLQLYIRALGRLALVQTLAELPMMNRSQNWYPRKYCLRPGTLTRRLYMVNTGSGTGQTVRPKYLDRSVIIEVDRPLFAPYFGAPRPVHCVQRPRFDVEDPGRAATGEPSLLRQQLAVLRRSARKRLKVTAADRIFWVWLRHVWGDWKSVLMRVKADTVVAWHRKGFRLFWTWKIHRGKRGRPSVPQEIRNLIRMLSRNNRAGVRHAFTANCSNWELRSRSRP